MEVKAVAKNVRISPIRVRLVGNLVRGKSVVEAKNILANTNNKASRIMLKALESAVSNAINNNDLKEENLYVKEAKGDQGMLLKRYRAKARGMAGSNNHRYTHVTVVVEDRR